MINFTNLRHSITAAIGAFVISTAFIAAAVAPAASFHSSAQVQA
jgi:hypothetical protein